MSRIAPLTQAIRRKVGSQGSAMSRKAVWLAGLVAVGTLVLVLSIAAVSPAKRGGPSSDGRRVGVGSAGGDRRSVGNAVLMARARRATLARRRWLGSTAVREQRVASRMAFHGLSAVGARDVMVRQLGSAVAVASVNPAVRVARAGRVSRYLGDYRAVVRKPDGHLDLEVSTVPLGVPNGKGAWLPVNLDLRRVGEGFAPARSSQSVSIAGTSRGGVGLGSKVGLVLQGTDVRGSLVGDKNVFFGNVGRDEDAVAAPTARGVELFGILRSALSPELLHYRVVMPRGAELRAAGGGALVVSGGRELAYVPAPSARDAQGQNVPVRMTIVGDELLLTVAHSHPGYAYPLLIDPEILESKPPGWTASGLGNFPYPGIIEGPAASYKEKMSGYWQWSRPNEASLIRSLYFYDISLSSAGELKWSATVGSGLIGGVETWRWAGSFNASAAEVAVEKMVGDERAPVLLRLSEEPQEELENVEGSAKFSVGAILAVIELNSGTNINNILGAFTGYVGDEEGFGLENPGVPNLNNKCLSGHYPVDCATGNQVESQTDMAIGGSRLGLKVTRTYNSQLATKMTSPGRFGYGWTGPYSARLALGEACNEFSCVETATVHQENGSTVRFELAPNKTYVAGSWVEGTLVKEKSGNYLYTLPNHDTLQFNSAGELTSEGDVFENKTKIARNSEGYISSVTDPSGRYLTFEYNSNGEVESIKDPMGNIVKYGYEAGNLVSVTEPGEAEPRWRFKYDSGHQMIGMTDGLGHTVTTEYDSSHRVTQQKDALGRTRQWKYGTTKSGAVETVITEPNGSVTAEQFNSAGLPTSVTRAWGTSLAATTTSEYDSSYNLVAVTDPDKHTTTYTYDSYDNRLSEMDPLQHKTTWTYSEPHKLTSETKPDGETTRYISSLEGRPPEEVMRSRR